MYSAPAQCSPLLRSMVECGWATARSSATDGPDISLHPIANLRLRQAQVLQDRVTPWTGRGRQHDRLGELLDGQPQVDRGDRQLVPAQAVDDLVEPPGVLAEEEAEGGTDPGELAVVGGAGKKLIHGMKDLMVSATGGTGGPGDHH